jgi:hypothetical protein
VLVHRAARPVRQLAVQVFIQDFVNPITGHLSYLALPVRR